MGHGDMTVASAIERLGGQVERTSGPLDARINTACPLTSAKSGALAFCRYSDSRLDAGLLCNATALIVPSIRPSRRGASRRSGADWGTQSATRVHRFGFIPASPGTARWNRSDCSSRCHCLNRSIGVHRSSRLCWPRLQHWAGLDNSCRRTPLSRDPDRREGHSSCGRRGGCRWIRIRAR